MLNREGTKLGSTVWRARSLVLLGILLISRIAAAGPTFVVNNLADLPAGPNTSDGICETTTPGECTLRAAIMEANATQDAIVRVPAGIYALTRASTGVGHPENGDLDVLSPMKIEGDGPIVSIIDAGGFSRVFFVDLAPSTGQVEMRGLSIGGGVAPGSFGGGIGSLSPLVLEKVHVWGSSALLGGGIAATSLTLRHSVVEGNRAIGNFSLGGGLLVQGRAVIEDSQIEGNRSDFGGGGLYLRPSITRIERTAIVGNSSGFSFSDRGGGGIYQEDGLLTVVNSVIFQNGGFGGAGLHVTGLLATTDLIHVTFTKNGSFGGAALVNDRGTVVLRRSIVTSNNGAGCVGSISSGDYNIVESPTSCPMTGQLAHNIIGTGFDVLSLNGGFSPDVSSISTVAEAAVPAGECVDDLGAPLTTDFRGYRRKPLACDIGAHDAGAIYEPAQLLGVNLLRNGGATGDELGLASSTATLSYVAPYQAPYWEGLDVQLLYGSPGFPTRSDAPPGSGYKFMSGGITVGSTARQTIDVSALTTQIDAGTLPYQIAGSFGGKSTESDRSTMDVEFYSAGFGFLDSFSLGGFDAAARGNQTRLLRAQRAGTVPVGTRMISVGITFENTNGGTNDAYADGLSVSLPEPNLAASLGAALIALAGVARNRRSRLA